jgi:hypothetical protein
VARNRMGESKPDWQAKQKPVNANELGIDTLMREYKGLYHDVKLKTKRLEEIKEHLKRFGTDFEIEVDGEKSWRVRSDGAFKPKVFQDAYPDKYADYLTVKRVEVFDLERFKSEQAALYEQFRTQRIEEIKNI